MIKPFTNVTLHHLLKSPEAFGEICYQYRKEFSAKETLVSKSLFAQMLNCQTIDLSRIENGIVTDFPLALRYLLLLEQTHNLFKNS